MIGRRILAILFVVFALISVMKGYFIFIILLFVLWWVIRWGADMFWWGRDNDKW